MKFICSLTSRTTSKTPPSFSVNPSICLLPSLSFNISLKDTYFHISINSIVLYLSPEFLLNFQSNFRIPPYMRKMFKFIEFKPLEMHWFQSFLLMPLLTQNSLPTTSHHALGRRKLLITPDSILSKICFPQQWKGKEETIICFKFSQKI